MTPAGNAGIRLRVAAHDLAAPGADALVAGCFEDARPLKGMAGELDWLLCGAFSRMIIGNRFTGRPGEAALFTSRGKVPARKLFLIGRGRSADGGPEAVQAFGRAVASTLVGAGVTSAAVSYEPAPPPDDEREGRAFLQGLADGAAGNRLDLLLLVRDGAARERFSRLLA